MLIKLKRNKHTFYRLKMIKKPIGPNRPVGTPRPLTSAQIGHLAL